MFYSSFKVFVSCGQHFFFSCGGDGSGALLLGERERRHVLAASMVETQGEIRIIKAITVMMYTFYYVV